MLSAECTPHFVQQLSLAAPFRLATGVIGRSTICQHDSHEGQNPEAGQAGLERGRRAAGAVNWPGQAEARDCVEVQRVREGLHAQHRRRQPGGVQGRLRGRHDRISTDVQQGAQPSIRHMTQYLRRVSNSLLCASDKRTASKSGKGRGRPSGVEHNSERSEGCCSGGFRRNRSRAVRLPTAWRDTSASIGV